jgi:hypothetical protein
LRLLVCCAVGLALAGCGSDERVDNLERLNARIEELGGPDAYPVVSLDLFFEGNDDPASIGPNLDPHPGLETFDRVLRAIRERPDVSDVVAQIDEVVEGEWPYVPAVYVVTTAAPEEVHSWAAEIQPDEYVGEEDSIGPWLGRGRPPGAPVVPDGSRVVTLFWD